MSMKDFILSRALQQQAEVVGYAPKAIISLSEPRTPYRGHLR